MVIDTSAIIAIAYDEPESAKFQRAIAEDNLRLISVASVIEASIVVARKSGRDAAPEALAQLDEIFSSLGLTIEPVTAVHIAIARDAYIRYGKSMHEAGLNYGDCFSYALAKDAGEPLLFKGDDFSKTDIRPYLADT